MQVTGLVPWALTLLLAVVTVSLCSNETSLCQPNFHNVNHSSEGTARIKRVSGDPEHSPCEELITGLNLAKKTSPELFWVLNIFNNTILEYQFRNINQNGRDFKIPIALHGNLAETNCEEKEDSLSNKNGNRGTNVNARRSKEAGKDDLIMHLVSGKFCGPNAWYNLVPVSPNLIQPYGNATHGSVPSWADMESMWADYMGNGCGNVDLYVFLQFPPPSTAVTNRPNGFRVCFRFLAFGKNIPESPWTSAHFDNSP